MIWVDVSGSGVLADGPITTVTGWRQVARLDRAGEFAFSCPAADARAQELLTVGRTVKAYMIRNGVVTLVGGGIIESVEQRLSQDAMLLDVRGGDWLRSLAFVSVANYSANNIDDAPADLVALASGWSLTGEATTGTNVTLALAYESVLAALGSVAQKIGEHFRLDGDAAVEWLPVAEEWADCGVRADGNVEPLAVEGRTDVAPITALGKRSDAADLANHFYVFGSGVAESRLTLAACTLAAPSGWTIDTAASTLTNTGSVTSYGQRDAVLVAKDIKPLSNTDADLESATNMLMLAAYYSARNLVQPGQFYSLSVTGTANILKPGEKIQVWAQRWMDGENVFDVDASLYILETDWAINVDGVETTTLTVGTVDRYPASDVAALVQSINQSIVMEMHDQIGPSVDTVAFREYLDDDHGATIYFWLGEEILTVAQVKLRYKTGKLRSTTKTVGGTLEGDVTLADHTHGVTVADHTHSVTVTAHSHGVTVADHTHTVPNHAHSMLMQGTGAPLVYPVGLADDTGTDKFSLVHPGSSNTHVWTEGSTGEVTSADGGGQTVTSADGGGQVVTSASGGGQSVTSAAGGGGTVELDLSSALTLEYGIYEDPDAAYAATDLEFLINGSAPTNAAVSEGGGWYAIDLTPDVSVALTHRPVQATNTVAVAVKTASKSGKKAQVDLEICVRTTMTQIIAGEGGGGGGTSHNDLAGLQGGSGDEFYHLTAAQHERLASHALTASRLVAADSDGHLASVSNLAAWVAGAAGRVTVTNDGDGTITLNVTESGLDHGSLAGLGEDDHTQYHNNLRGDARYSQLGHTHAGGDITSAVANATNADTVDGYHASSFVFNTLLTTRGDIIRRGASAPERYALSVPSSPTINVLGARSTDSDPTWLSASSNPGAAAAILQSNASGVVQLQGIIAPYLRAASDSTTAVQIQASAGTAVLTVDTTNGLLGMNRTPSTYLLDLQVPTAVTSGGSFLRMTAAHASGDEFTLSNATGTGGAFVPFFATTINNHNSAALQFSARIAGAQDTGSNAVFVMDARLSSNAVLATRPAFDFRNYTTTLLRLGYDGKVGVYTSSPTLSDGAGVDINGKLLRLRTSKTPASATDTGNVGEICWDGSYIYVCTATNTWRRAAIAAW